MKMLISHSQPVLEALQALLPTTSRNRLRQFIQEGRVLIDNKVCCHPNYSLNSGELLVFSEQRIQYEANIKILFHDDHLVVIEKPSGLLSVSTNFETKQTAHAILKNRYKNKKVYVIHRLDQETSGLMLFALNDTAYQILKNDLKYRKIKREYIALVEGKLEGSGLWQSYLYEDQNYNVFSSDDPKDGELASTHYEALSFKNGVTTLYCRLDTGKKHQIRVHAQRANHPIIGDSRYNEKNNDLNRLGLHACHLEFAHPQTKKNLSFTSKPPREFQKFTSSSI